MLKCNGDTCRLTSIKGLVKPPVLSKLDFLRYITEWKLP